MNKIEQTKEIEEMNKFKSSNEQYWKNEWKSI